jgi:hypothetical protein
MYIEIQREELGAEATRWTQTHEVCMVVIVEQLKLHEFRRVKRTVFMSPEFKQSQRKSLISLVYIEVPGSILGHFKGKKSSGSGTGSTQPREYN